MFTNFPSKGFLDVNPFDRGLAPLAYPNRSTEKEKGSRSEHFPATTEPVGDGHEAWPVTDA